MKKQEILQILKQIFEFSPQSESIILQNLNNLDERKEEELVKMLLNYTTKQNELLVELNKTLIKGKNELNEVVEDASGESAEEIIAKI